jgi:nucleoside-diphosphate kinase
VLSLGNLGWKPNLVNQPNSPTKLEYSMSIEQTLSIIKPDAVGKNVIGKIMDRFESAGLKIVACRMMHLSREQAEAFYAVHKDRPFYGELVEYMISGAVIIQILEGEEAIQRNRDVMGATNPTEAAPGTIRADFAESVQANAVHGSDSPTTAQQEISYFFDPTHISSRN